MTEGSKPTAATQKTAVGAGMVAKGAVTLGGLAWLISLLTEENGDLAKRIVNAGGEHPVALVCGFFFFLVWFCGKPALVAVLKRKPKEQRSNLAVFLLAFVSAGTHLWNLLFGSTPLRMKDEETTAVEITLCECQHPAHFGPCPAPGCMCSSSVGGKA